MAQESDVRNDTRNLAIKGKYPNQCNLSAGTVTASCYLSLMNYKLMFPHSFQMPELVNVVTPDSGKTRTGLDSQVCEPVSDKFMVETAHPTQPTTHTGKPSTHGTAPTDHDNEREIEHFGGECGELWVAVSE
jgi:hypothetical protein